MFILGTADIDLNFLALVGTLELPETPRDRHAPLADPTVFDDAFESKNYLASVGYLCIALLTLV